jgi:hypothetical protein
LNITSFFFVENPVDKYVNCCSYFVCISNEKYLANMQDNQTFDIAREGNRMPVAKPHLVVKRGSSLRN